MPPPIFPPPPLWASPVLIEERTGQSSFHPAWLRWFLDLVAVLQASGGGTGQVQHNDTGGLQGGQANQFYHLTLAEYTGTGTGAFVRSISPSLTTPSIGAATGTSLSLTGGATVVGGAQFLSTNTALNNNAGAATGTLANAPVAGNPTKWIAINDSGTLRRIPTW